MGKEIKLGLGSYFNDQPDEPRRLSALELPPDKIVFRNNDGVYGVSYHSFKALEVKVDHYTVNDNGVKFTRLPDQDIKLEDLPDKVRKIFNAGTRSNVENLVETGELTRVRLE